LSGFPRLSGEDYCWVVAAGREISNGLFDLEDIAFRIVAIAGFAAFKFPFALDGSRRPAQRVPGFFKRRGRVDGAQRQARLSRRAIEPI
jgi:hypothetical protein